MNVIGKVTFRITLIDIFKDHFPQECINDKVEELAAPIVKCETCDWKLSRRRCVRTGGPSTSATGVTRVGKREVLSIDVGTNQACAFCLRFLCSLKMRGHSGVQLVTSVARYRLLDGIATMSSGTEGQRCPTHSKTSLHAMVPRRAQRWVARMARTVCQEPSPEEVHTQYMRMVGIFPNRASVRRLIGEVLAEQHFAW